MSLLCLMAVIRLGTAAQAFVRRGGECRALAAATRIGHFATLVGAEHGAPHAGLRTFVGIYKKGTIF